MPPLEMGDEIVEVGSIIADTVIIDVQILPNTTIPLIHPFTCVSLWNEKYIQG